VALCSFIEESTEKSSRPYDFFGNESSFDGEGWEFPAVPHVRLFFRIASYARKCFVFAPHVSSLIFAL
jgi:hypothetical protein